jgi:8-oxo-dGTP pyrophosphatase MutT (NUDIX family)
MARLSEVAVRQQIAVKALILRPDRRLLLLRRPPGPSSSNPLKYSPPGGVVEAGETLVTALRREVLEETRLEIIINSVVGVSEWYVPRYNSYYVGIFYSCQLLNSSAEAVLDRENNEYVWASKLDLANLDIMHGSSTIVEHFLASPNPVQIPK